MRRLFVLLLLASTPALADPRDQVMDRAAQCATLADSRQWLDCFYGAAQPMRAYLNQAPAPQGQAAPSQATAQPSRQAAGEPPPMPQGPSLFGDMFGGRPVVAGLRMRDYSFSHGVFTVTLEDGEVWQQEAHPRDYASWNKPAGGYVVTISRGALDSYDFRVEGIKAFYKVHRVR